MDKMIIDKQARLNEIEHAIVADTSCQALAAGAHRLVMGEGNLGADIVFIGEAPGKKEDEVGRPFVGASGKFLDEMLTMVGLERSDVYVTNIVKYRPPNNRDPSSAEKKAFLPYLLEQLQIIDPKVIVTLGRHSMEYFLPDMTITQAHGRVVHKKIAQPDGKTTEWLIMPLYHPAAALYNGSLRTVLMADMQQLGKIIHASYIEL